MKLILQKATNLVSLHSDRIAVKALHITCFNPPSCKIHIVTFWASIRNNVTIRKSLANGRRGDQRVQNVSHEPHKGLSSAHMELFKEGQVGEESCTAMCTLAVLLPLQRSKFIALDQTLENDGARHSSTYHQVKIMTRTRHD